VKKKEVKIFFVFVMILILIATPIISANTISKKSTSESTSDYDVEIVFKFLYSETKGPSAYIDRLDAPNFHNKKQDLNVKITVDQNIGTNPYDGHKFRAYWSADVYAGSIEHSHFPAGGGRHLVESYRLGDDFKDGESGLISTTTIWNLNFQHLAYVEIYASCKLTYYQYEWNNDSQEWDLMNSIPNNNYKGDMTGHTIGLSKTRNNLFVNRLLNLPICHRILEKLTFLSKLH